MTVFSAVFGLLTAYVLVRYEFPGKSFLNAIIDLPLAIPTLVTGVMLVILYGPQSAVAVGSIKAGGSRLFLRHPGDYLGVAFYHVSFCGTHCPTCANGIGPHTSSGGHIGQIVGQFFAG